MTLLWLKALHIFFLVAWMAGMFYLPRLFVYHAQTTSSEVSEQFKVMERRLWWFVLPFAILTLGFGVALIYVYGMGWFAASHWLHAKMTLVALVYGYYVYLFVLMKRFARGENQRSHNFYRFINEAPVLIFLAIVILAVVKPF